MKKAMIFILSIVLLTSFVLAAPAAPSPTCRINGEIIQVSSDEMHSCKYMEGITVTARYSLKVKINQVSIVTEDGSSTCEELYPINSEQTLKIYKHKIESANTFKEDEFLIGNIHFEGDECTGGIYLIDYSTSHIEPIENNENNEEDRNIVGESCGTVTPGYNNECCQRKGYDRWNSDSFECEGALNFSNMTKEQRREMFEEGKEIRMQVREEFKNQMREIQIERIENQLRIRAGNYSANCSDECDFNETINKSMLMKRLSNGRNAEIKVMPDSAAERALERLRLHVCNESTNCSIELKEVGKDKDVYLVYELQRERKAKILGFIKSDMGVRVRVDAETGEIVKTKKPWWAFLASEPEAE